MHRQIQDMKVISLFPNIVIIQLIYCCLMCAAGNGSSRFRDNE